MKRFLFQLPENLPDFIPNFSNLESGLDEQAGPLHFTTLQGVAPSYNPVGRLKLLKAERQLLRH